MQTERAVKLSDGAATSVHPASAVAGDASRHERKASALRPICVDLDGTLVRTDTLFEGVLAILSHPAAWRHLPSLFTASRAAWLTLPPVICRICDR